MLELAGKDNKTITIFLIFKRLRPAKYKKKTKITSLETKATVSEMKSAIGRIGCCRGRDLRKSRCGDISFYVSLLLQVTDG